MSGRRLLIGNRYVDVPPDRCPNRRHPRGRFHARQSGLLPWHPVAVVRRASRWLRYGCDCEVASPGAKEWAVFATVNWTRPPRRERMTHVSDEAEARANWVLLNDMRGYHDVNVERVAS